MVYLVAGIGLLLVLVVFGRAFVAADPRSVVRAIRYALGTLLIAVGAVLLLGERFGLAVPLIAAGVSALSVGRIGPLDLGGSLGSHGTTSKVSSRFLEMHLDHDTGAMTGKVLEGENAGRVLDEFDVASLIRFRAEIASDSQSVALLEAYLDRRIPGWREDLEGDEDPRAGSPPNTGAMADEEAYEVLGLAAGAGEAEIRAAHRRLMMRMHPDQGGSTFLAAKINEAKDRLLGRRHR